MTTAGDEEQQAAPARRDLERPALLPLATNTWDGEEEEAIREVMASGRLTMGPRVAAFEEAFAAYVGVPHAVMVNSGSSANLLAVAAHLYRRSRPLRPGDEVIVPAVSWGTTYFPVHQHGLSLRFVDVERDTFTIDPDRVAEAITPRTRAVFAVDLLGATCDYARLQSLCEEHDLILLEDACEALGAESDGRRAGAFGSCASHSTYFSHHISTVEGGLVTTADEELHHILLALRAHGWTRDLPADNRVHPKSDDPFYNLFTFVLPGYNVRPQEFAGAVGVRQLAKVPGFLEHRRRNGELFGRLVGEIDGFAVQQPWDGSSWFGLGLVLVGHLAGRRDELVHLLARHGVETRPIVAGNFVRNPAVRHMDHSIAGPLTEAERLHHDGILLGNHQVDVADALHGLRDLLAAFADGTR